MSKTKKGVLALLSIFSSITIWAQGEITMNSYHSITEASMINMKSKQLDTTEFETFLVAGGKLVRETEPETKIWFALKSSDNTLTIFDAFYDSAGRDAHFAGQVAAALKNNSDKLVLDGWKNGVLKHVTNSKILSASLPENQVAVSVANYLEFRANEGKEEELAALLANAAELVNKTEPGTSYWVALQLDNNRFAIFDAFADEEGQKAHFAGQVAMALRDQAEALIQNGWEKGVLAHVQNFEVVTNV